MVSSFHLSIPKVARQEWCWSVGWSVGWLVGWFLLGWFWLRESLGVKVGWLAFVGNDVWRIFVFVLTSCKVVRKRIFVPSLLRSFLDSLIRSFVRSVWRENNLLEQ